MKKLSRYTILNLESRPERRLLAYCNAIRDGVPKKRIHFWTGLDFETLDELGRHAVENGFQRFKPLIGRSEPVRGTMAGQNYNLIRYLTDRVQRDTLELFVHDDVYFNPKIVYASGWKYIKQLCRYMQTFVPKSNAECPEFNILQLDPHNQWDLGKSHDIKPEYFRKRDNLILKGIWSICDFALVLSQKGAQMILDKLLARDDWIAMEALFIRKNHENDWYWSPAGAYTTAFPIVKRFPIKVAGSDTEDARIGLFEIEAKRTCPNREA